MKGLAIKFIIAGVTLLIIGFIASLPSIILGMAGSPIKSEGEVYNKILDTFQETANNEQVTEIADKTKDGISMLESIPTLLIFIGIIFSIIGLVLLFIPEN